MHQIIDYRGARTLEELIKFVENRGVQEEDDDEEEEEEEEEEEGDDLPRDEL